MTEPTLGQRILDAAMRWAFDRALCGIEVGRESEDQLRALAARADAAEQLAKCCHELNNIDFDDYLEALAAWRAITEEVQP